MVRRGHVERQRGEAPEAHRAVVIAVGKDGLSTFLQFTATRNNRRAVTRLLRAVGCPTATY
jgi:hypothetical protein